MDVSKAKDIVAEIDKNYQIFEEKINAFYYTIISISGGAVVATISFITPKNYPLFHQYSIWLYIGWVLFGLTMISAFLRILKSIYFHKKMKVDIHTETTGPVGISENELMERQKNFFTQVSKEGHFIRRLTNVIPVLFILAVVSITIFAILVSSSTK